MAEATTMTWRQLIERLHAARTAIRMTGRDVGDAVLQVSALDKPDLQVDRVGWLSFADVARADFDLARDVAEIKVMDIPIKWDAALPPGQLVLRWEIDA